MILKQFQEVFDIDNRIVKMHEALFDLYRERASIVNPNQALNPPALSTQAYQINLSSSEPKRLWAMQQYEELVNNWQIYKINLPAYKKLEPKLLGAYDIIGTVCVLMPELQGKLGVLIVPPKKNLEFPASPKLRQLKDTGCDSDLVSSGLPKTKATGQWRVLVAYNCPRGMYLESPKKIIDEKLFLKADYDLSALGLLEYTALSLQEPETIDIGTWTALLKDYKGGDLVPYVTFVDSRYRFEMGSTDSLYANVRFRPAIEVKL